MAAASTWSKPGQSLPRRTGTGRSFSTPTSTGQAPGADGHSPVRHMSGLSMHTRDWEGGLCLPAGCEDTGLY